MTDPEPLPMTREQLTARKLVIAAVEKWLKTEKTRVNEELNPQMSVGERLAGFTDPTRRDTTTLGFVSKVRGSTTAKVKNMPVVLDWAKRHTPGEVVTTETVRESFLDKLLDSVKEHGGWVDPVTHEVINVPGVEVTTKDPYLTSPPNDDALRLVTEALATQRLALLPADKDSR